MTIKKNPFYNAFRGIKWFAISQWNAKVHFIATVLVLVLSFYLNINTIEWLFIIIAFALVWIVELLNTAIEFTLDKLHPLYDPLVGKAKDTAAAAVLIASVVAIIIGAIIFIPKISMLI